MESRRSRREIDALKAYVIGDSSEPVLLSAFRGVPLEERTRILTQHRAELERIDDARLTILESMLLPLDDRRR